MENHRHAPQMSIYTCPMPPEVNGTQGNSCSTCGMDLRSVQQENPDQYQVQLTTLPQIIEAGHPVRLLFAIKKNQKQVPLDISDEMNIHVIVISEDLNWFRHIHPVLQQDGSYAVTQTFHNGGKYHLFTYFKPHGKEHVLNMLEIEVKGYYMTSREVTSKKTICYIDDYTVILENTDNFKTGSIQRIKIAIEKCEKKLHNSSLEQYLGTSAHILMINKTDKEFLQIRSIPHVQYPIYAETNITKAGKYKMWVQFKIHGKVHTADFNIDIRSIKESEKEVKLRQHQV